MSEGREEAEGTRRGRKRGRERGRKRGSAAPPVITREGEPGDFRYRLDGARVTSVRELARIERLAVPPAWVDVEIARSPRAKVQASGTDAAGRVQAIYHPAFRRRRDRQKFDRVIRFGGALPALRAAVDRDLRHRSLSRDRVTAGVIRLIDLHHFRVGNRRYEAAHGSFGVTTLRRRHMRLSRARADLDFPGKSGRRHRVRIADARLVRLLERLDAVPGAELFAFVDEDGETRGLRSSQVNAYVKRHLGEEYSAKDFRTWAGTLQAVTMLLSTDPIRLGTERGRAGVRTEIERAVAGELGNTQAVTRSSYIDPRVFEAMEEPELVDGLRRRLSRLRSRRYQSIDEQAALMLLRHGRAD